MVIQKKQLNNYMERIRIVVFIFIIIISSCTIVEPERVNLFKIKKIKRYENDFIIIAKRNDSLFYIRSLENNTHLAGSNRIRKGGLYYLDLYEILPLNYTRFTGRSCFIPISKHIARYSDIKYHWKNYYPNNLNGLYLEVPPSDSIRQYLIESSLSFRHEFDGFIYEKEFDKRFTIKDDMNCSRYKVLSTYQICPDRILIKTRKDDSTYYMISKVYPYYNIKSKKIKKGQFIYLETRLVSSISPELGIPNQGSKFFLCEHGFLDIKSKDVFEYYLIENLNGLYYLEE